MSRSRPTGTYTSTSRAEPRQSAPLAPEVRQRTPWVALPAEIDLAAFRAGVVTQGHPTPTQAEHTIALVVGAATSWTRGQPMPSAIRCRRRPSHVPCEGHLVLLATDVPRRILWNCSECGTGGSIRHWRNTPWDQSNLVDEWDDDAWLGEIEVQLDREAYRAVAAALFGAADVDPQVRRFALRATTAVDGGIVFEGSPHQFETLDSALRALPPRPWGIRRLSALRRAQRAVRHALDQWN